MFDLAEPAFSYDLDVFDVADYLIDLDARRPEPDVTPLKLAKLLYLAQANYLASTERRMFDEKVEAFENGPLIYREWQRHMGPRIIATREDVTLDEATRLPSDAVEFLDEVWGKYKDWSASRLWTLTHEQDPWKDNYFLGSYRAVIPDEDMKAYFRDSSNVDRIFHSGVVIIPEGLLDESDADVFAAKYAEFMRQ